MNEGKCVPVKDSSILRRASRIMRKEIQICILLEVSNPTRRVKLNIEFKTVQKIEGKWFRTFYLRLVPHYSVEIYFSQLNPRQMITHRV